MGWWSIITFRISRCSFCCLEKLGDINKVFHCRPNSLFIESKVFCIVFTIFGNRQCCPHSKFSASVFFFSLNFICASTVRKCIMCGKSLNSCGTLFSLLRACKPIAIQAHRTMGLQTHGLLSSNPFRLTILYPSYYQVIIYALLIIYCNKR